MSVDYWAEMLAELMGSQMAAATDLQMDVYLVDYLVDSMGHRMVSLKVDYSEHWWVDARAQLMGMKRVVLKAPR
jgi:hypothetical protein